MATEVIYRLLIH